MAKIQRYSVGKEDGAFWFEIDPVVATSVVDMGFPSWSCALQPGEDQL
jgi:hypothetical protein